MDEPSNTTMMSGRSIYPAVVLGATLSMALRVLKLLPGAEAVLVGSIVMIVAMYWLPPRPERSFLGWSVEGIGIMVCCYLALLKIPMLLKPLMVVSLSYGIPAALLIMLLGLWLRFRWLSVRK